MLNGRDNSRGLRMKPLRLIFAALILTSPLLAQNESGASLTIRFADGTNRFHVGEIIPVELLFKPSVAFVIGAPQLIGALA